jgi:hypothetical protein
MTRTEAEFAQAVAVRAFAELLVDCMNDPRLSARVERFASALLLATTADAATPRAEVISIGK